MKLPYWGESISPTAIRCKECGVIYTSNVPKYCETCLKRGEEAIRKSLPLAQTLVDAVKAHAHKNYEKDGWDYVVESYEDKEIWEEIAGCKTPEKAIKKMHGIVSMLDDRRKDIEATAY